MQGYTYFLVLFLFQNIDGTQLLIVIFDAKWNVNAYYYELSYASAISLRMRRSTSFGIGRQVPHVFALVKINKAEFTKSASTLICKILRCSHLKSIGILTDLVFFSLWFIKFTGRYNGATESH